MPQFKGTYDDVWWPVGCAAVANNKMLGGEKEKKKMDIF